MKKLIGLFLTFIITAAMFSSSVLAKTEYEEIKTNIPSKILFLGDSIATGYGLEGYKNGKENCSSYANTLADQYDKELAGKCETSMKNSAIDGQTSAELLKGLNDGIYDEDLKNSDAVIISIGGNDLLTVLWEFIVNDLHINFNDSYADNQQSDFDITKIIESITSLGARIDKNLESFDSNLTEIAKYIKEKTNGTLIIQTLYNPFDQFNQEQVKEFISDKIKTLNSYIELHKNDADSQYIVADVYSQFYGKGNELTRIKSMDIHPNQQGHDVIAQCVDKTIRTERYTYITEKTKEAVQSSSIGQNNSDKSTIICFIAIGIVVIIAFVITIIKRKNTKKEN